MKELITFNGSTDYRFEEILRNDKFVVYKQLDKDDLDRLVAFEIHKRMPSGNKWFKTVKSMTRVNDIPRES